MASHTSNAARGLEDFNPFGDQNTSQSNSSAPKVRLRNDKIYTYILRTYIQAVHVLVGFLVLKIFPSNRKLIKILGGGKR